jgi:3-oxoacyl-[acyl-carrier-protein] synthase II
LRFLIKSGTEFEFGPILNFIIFMQLPRIVITGLGLTSPNGDSLAEYRANLLAGVSGIEWIDLRYMGRVPAGVCHFDPRRYQGRKEIRNGTRAGSIAIYCAHEAFKHAAFGWESFDKSRIGVYIGITEHGNVETENEVYNISQFDYDTKFWTHHHNPRTVANNAAGEVTLNMGIIGPHLTIGAACAAGNAGIIQGVQMLQLGEVDVALAGGVSESIQSFGIFAGFKSQGALAVHEDPTKASRPFDKNRNGIVVSEGGCLYVLERLDDALARGAPIVAEVTGYGLTSDAKDPVLPDPDGQIRCIEQCLRRAGRAPQDVDIVSTHATATGQGDIQECTAIRKAFANCPDTWINNTKSFIGHAMGAAGALELAGNIPSLTDGIVHPTINVDELDPDCDLPNLVLNENLTPPRGVRRILNNSFGMLGINSSVLVERYEGASS